MYTPTVQTGMYGLYKHTYTLTHIHEFIRTGCSYIRTYIHTYMFYGSMHVHVSEIIADYNEKFSTHTDSLSTNNLEHKPFSNYASQLHTYIYT